MGRDRAPPPPSSYGSLEAPLARGAVPAPPALQGHKWGHASGHGGDI